MSRPRQKGLGLGHFGFLSWDRSNSAFRNPHSAIKRWGPIGPWAMVVRICDHPRNLARSFSKRKSSSTVGDASADVDRRSKSQARHFSPGPANTTHYSDRRREFYNDYWPPWDLTVGCIAVSRHRPGAVFSRAPAPPGRWRLTPGGDRDSTGCQLRKPAVCSLPSRVRLGLGCRLWVRGQY